MSANQGFDYTTTASAEQLLKWDFRKNGTTLFADLITEKQAARELHMKPGTLQKWRSTGKSSLPYYKVGRSVFYKYSDLQKFVEDQRRG